MAPSLYITIRNCIGRQLRVKVYTNHIYTRTFSYHNYQPLFIYFTQFSITIIMIVLSSTDDTNDWSCCCQVPLLFYIYIYIYIYIGCNHKKNSKSISFNPQLSNIICYPSVLRVQVCFFYSNENLFYGIDILENINVPLPHNIWICEDDVECNYLILKAIPLSCEESNWFYWHLPPKDKSHYSIRIHFVNLS